MYHKFDVTENLLFAQCFFEELNTAMIDVQSCPSQAGRSITVLRSPTRRDPGLLAMAACAGGVSYCPGCATVGKADPIIALNEVARLAVISREYAPTTS
jgi:hypothetical protein